MEYKWRWKEIGEFLGNLKRPKGKTPKEMQQFRWEATKYFVSDAVLYWRWKSNELLAEGVTGHSIKKERN